MKAIKRYYQSAYSRRLTQEARLGECVFFEHAILKGPDTILLLLIISVQGTKVEVRGALDLCIIKIVGAENVVDDDSSKVEEVR